MEKKISEFKELALQSLRGKWTDPVIAALVYFLLSGLLQGIGMIPFVGFIICLLFSLPFNYGAGIIFYLKFYRQEKVGIENFFDGFKDYGRIFGTMLLLYVYTFLWTLLLIVPGIIKSCSYAMTPYILADNPELKFNAAIEKSMKMMDGYKMKYFLLNLSFIGWFLLSILTLGIGLLWLVPYVLVTNVAFYEELKANQQATVEELPAE